MQRTRAITSGWGFTAACCAVLSLLFVARFLAGDGGEESIRGVVRLSAQTSVALFCAAFAASSVRIAWKSAASAWLLRNRRYVGVSFAFSHAAHLAALVALAQVSPEFVSGLNPVTLVGGGLAYAFIGLMAATSSDRAVAALGRQRWQRLHKVGGYYVWILFAQSYLPRAFLVSPAYALPSALLILAIGLRLYAARRSRPR